MKSQILSINNICTAGCAHCSFVAHGQHKSLKEVFSEILVGHSPIIIVSGGEPFEHPEILSLLGLFSSLTRYTFRIATGGHISLLPYYKQLSSMNNLSGISIGTDVLIRKNNADKAIWYANLKLLKKCGINFSLTFTIGTDVYEKLNFIIDLIKEASPDFVLIHPNDNYKRDLSSYDDFIQVFNQIEGVSFKYENFN